jgi:hypothetical protein
MKNWVLLLTLPLAGLPDGIAGAEPRHSFKPLTAAEQQAIRAAVPLHARAKPAKARRVLSPRRR